MDAKQDLLNSWKEIAHYLNRGVRTAQRWEAELGLPVRRPRGRERSAVIAIRAEIDEWLRARPLAVGDRSFQHTGLALELAAPQPAHGEIAPVEVSERISEFRRLRAESVRLQEELSSVAGRLTAACQRLGGKPAGRNDQHELPAQEGRTMAGAVPRKVLIVDDNEIQSYVMTKALELAGFVVYSVLSGNRALAMMKEKKPDAVILDVNMPEMNGFQVCSRIKEDPQNSRLPVIFYTAAGLGNKAYAKSLGATAFLTYPMNPEHLARVISTSIAMSQC